MIFFGDDPTRKLGQQMAETWYETLHTLSLSLSLSHTDRHVPGCYAMSVSGDLPQDIIDSLQDKGVPYTKPHVDNACAIED